MLKNKKTPVGRKKIEKNVTERNDWLGYIDNIGGTLSEQNTVSISSSKSLAAESLAVVLITL